MSLTLAPLSPFMSLWPGCSPTLPTHPHLNIHETVSSSSTAPSQMRRCGSLARNLLTMKMTHALWLSNEDMPLTSLLDTSTLYVHSPGSMSRASVVRCQRRLLSCLTIPSLVPFLGLVTLAQLSLMARAGLLACSLVVLESLKHLTAPTLPP